MRAIVLTIAILLPAQPVWAQATERTVYASVVDNNDAPVTGLSASEFIVREDDAAREVLRVSAATEPMQIAVLVDTSQAMEEHMLDVRTALRGFFKQMAGKHEIALIGTGERPTVLSDYTRDPRVSRRRSGPSSLDRAAAPTSSMRSWKPLMVMRRRKAARPHIIVYAARGPEFSERYHESVHRRAARIRRDPAHVAAEPGRALRSASREEQELAKTVADGTKDTGGRRDDLLTPMALADRLLSLGNEIENQHQIVYARPAKLIPPKTMEVTAKRPGVTVRARRMP